MDGFLKLKLPPWKRVLMTRSGLLFGIEYSDECSVAMIPAILVAVVARMLFFSACCSHP
jgi:hypothetical protein